MEDRTELMEAVLEHLPQGAALLGEDGHLLLWNRAAECVTGYTAAELLGRPIPPALEPLLLAWRDSESSTLIPSARALRGTLVHLHHRAGHPFAAMTHSLLLRNGLGRPIGTAVLFHSTDSGELLDQLRDSQAEVEERLDAVFADFLDGGPPFGILWIAIDQAPDLRRTHGAAASLAMLEKVEHSIANGLRPGEAIGRWGDGEFLVIAHERAPDLLARHAAMLAALARTADFRWWGDRLTLTVSVGAAHAAPGCSLAELLEAARAAMFLSFQAGGNQITSAPGRQACSPS